MGIQDRSGLVVISNSGAVGESIARACTRRGLAAVAIRPSARPLGTATALVLDLTGAREGVVSSAVAHQRTARPVIVAIGEWTDLQGTGLAIDVWVGIDARPEELLGAIGRGRSVRSLEATPQAPSAEVEQLTMREREVLSELVVGGGAVSMGRRLGMSETSVRVHLQSAMLKLGLASQVEAAAWALRAGVDRYAMVGQAP